MNPVDNFVRTRILTYPRLFPNRTAVLHHTLCVLGNGYEWDENGEVASVYFEPVNLWNKETQLTQLDADMKARVENEEIRNMLTEGLRKDIENLAQIVEEVDTRMYEMGEVSIYPQSNYALLMNIPANVTPEWKEACEEMKVLAEEAGWEF